MRLKLRSFDDWYEYMSKQEEWQKLPERLRLHGAFVHGFLHGLHEHELHTCLPTRGGKPGEPSHPRKSEAE